MDINQGIELMQFDVVSHKFVQTMNNSQLQAHITFQRKLMYQMTNTYLPTISLLMIVILTMYIDESRLEIAVTLSLTVMLVMYTFYQSISLLIPQTAYLKFIDYWLIFCLLGPFLIFITECIWYLYQSKEEKGWMKDETKLSSIILNHKGFNSFCYCLCHSPFYCNLFYCFHLPLLLKTIKAKNCVLCYNNFDFHLPVLI